MKFYTEILVALVLLIEVSVAYGWDHPKAAIPGQFPHQASLELSLTREINEFHYCGGSIIDEFWILTSAYCVTNVNLGSLVVKVGRHNISVVDEYVQSSPIHSVIVHPKYAGVTALENLGTYDVGLIRLAKPLVFNARVQPIQLPEKTGIFSTTYKLNYNLILSGWGAVAHGVIPNHPKVLLTVHVPLIVNKVCQDSIKNIFPHFKLDDSQMCTRPIDGSLAACIGDYGGPLIQYDKNHKPVIVAVHSWTTSPCSTNGLPPIYTRIPPFTKWIKNSIKSFKLSKPK